METVSYQSRRGQLEEYFDRTAADTWARLTSDASVSRVRATVRAGRDQMRAALLGYLPEDMRGQRLLDAGCGTGALAVEAARRGAEVVATDLSATLVGVARERVPKDLGTGSVTFMAGDMLDPSLGTFDWVVAMDSLIHYEEPDMVEMVARLAARARRGMLFTFAPKTVMLSLMWTVGKAFPRSDRSPAIVPVAETNLRARLARHKDLSGFAAVRTHRVDSTFYISQALEVLRA